MQGLFEKMKAVQSKQQKLKDVVDADLRKAPTRPFLAVANGLQVALQTALHQARKALYHLAGMTSNP